MGPSAVRRDIMSRYRQEKRQLGITSRGKRGRRSRGPGWEAATGADAAAASVHARRPRPTRPDEELYTPNGSSDKENKVQPEHGIHDDEEEFFDAEDAGVDGEVMDDEDVN